MEKLDYLGLFIQFFNFILLALIAYGIFKIWKALHNRLK